MHRIKIIVPANTTAFNERILAAVAPVKAPDVEIGVANITAGRPHIENRCDLTENAPHVIAAVIAAEKEGYNAVFVTDFDMCGVEASREAVGIPVIGGFTACACTALAISSKFSIITILRSIIAMQRAHVYEIGVPQDYASIRPINIQVEDLAKVEFVTARVFEEAEKAIREDGAEAILLGCTGFVGIAADVQNLLAQAGLFVPVLDPNQVGIAFVEMLVRTGLAQSRATYPRATVTPTVPGQ